MATHYILPLMLATCLVLVLIPLLLLLLLLQVRTPFLFQDCVSSSLFPRIFKSQHTLLSGQVIFSYNMLLGCYDWCGCRAEPKPKGHSLAHSGSQLNPG